VVEGSRSHEQRSVELAQLADALDPVVLTANCLGDQFLKALDSIVTGLAVGRNTTSWRRQ